MFFSTSPTFPELLKADDSGPDHSDLETLISPKFNTSSWIEREDHSKDQTCSRSL